MDRFISLKEAADKLGISDRNVRRMIDRKILPPIIKIGKSARLPESAIAKYQQMLIQASLRGLKI